MSAINTIGIVGGGKMGTSIFNWLSQFNDGLIWVVRSNHEKARKKYNRKLQRAFKNELLSENSFNRRSVNHIITNKLSALQPCDLVIETIAENLNDKKDLVKQLLLVVRDDVVIATNSSSFFPWQLSDNKNQQKRIVGLHFFYPVNFKNVVEFICVNETDSQNIKIKQLLSSKGITIIQQNATNAFLLNRLMLQLQVEAFRLHESGGYSIFEIDKAVDTFLFPIGLFVMMDHIGLDILQTAVQNYALLESDLAGILEFQNCLNQKVAAGELGVKSAIGFYDYSKNVTDNNFKNDRLKFIAKRLAETYYNAFNFYVQKGYSSPEELILAMNVYLDCDTERWRYLVS